MNQKNYSSLFLFRFVLFLKMKIGRNYFYFSLIPIFDSTNIDNLIKLTYYPILSCSSQTFAETFAVGNYFKLWTNNYLTP
jgi:hypothetical protein